MVCAEYYFFNSLITYNENRTSFLLTLIAGTLDCVENSKISDKLAKRDVLITSPLLNHNTQHLQPEGRKVGFWLIVSEASVHG